MSDFSMAGFKLGEWCIYGFDIVQITKRDAGSVRVSDGSFESGGAHTLADLRSLTLRNKRIAENFGIIYNRLHELDGQQGFNYPDIKPYFESLSRRAIDGQTDHSEDEATKLAAAFIEEAKEYRPRIQGIRFFRPKL